MQGELQNCMKNLAPLPYKHARVLDVIGSISRKEVEGNLHKAYLHGADFREAAINCGDRPRVAQGSMNDKVEGQNIAMNAIMTMYNMKTVLKRVTAHSSSPVMQVVL